MVLQKESKETNGDSTINKAMGIEAKFDGLRSFKNGFAAAKKGGKWGLINEVGEWIVEPTLGGIKDVELVK
ncbi:MAG: hypothetical protein COB15_04290 [Flavobacteriales bacterium]|nr:MAG: hypothetical protein COB15_04290 [Flavobacteriales bacterium]